ncbi:hypothetical protein Ahy_A07g031352 [Arachis hypogaea]|uniref:Uncharacterized protein n=1 Tax=Arachis hypogaea TaxID=3818 RepID=A0A445C3K0_ARAHY|nr:hypothetical protein Ahy_A07g031352 [Arachis hypogaea]
MDHQGHILTKKLETRVDQVHEQVNYYTVQADGTCDLLLHMNFNVQYFCMFEKLNDFCNHPWNKKVATLKLDYCNTPWKTVALIAGIFLFILTIIQTVFSILQVVLA